MEILSITQNITKRQRYFFSVWALYIILKACTSFYFTFILCSQKCVYVEVDTQRVQLQRNTHCRHKAILSIAQEVKFVEYKLLVDFTQVKYEMHRYVFRALSSILN